MDERQSWRMLAISAPLVLALVALLLHAAGRNAIYACGHVALWHGAVDGENSQHLLDWYSPSHIIHGLIFYAAGRLLLPELALPARVLIALIVEGGWELLENSPMVIDRYRTATIALGYTGDTIVNSLADIGCMAAGFVLASRLPARASILIALAFELLTLAIIRDNLTLNVLMLIHPVEAIREWQAA